MQSVLYVVFYRSETEEIVGWPYNYTHIDLAFIKSIHCRVLIMNMYDLNNHKCSNNCSYLGSVDNDMAGKCVSNWVLCVLWLKEAKHAIKKIAHKT